MKLFNQKYRLFLKIKKNIFFQKNYRKSIYRVSFRLKKFYRGFWGRFWRIAREAAGFKQYKYYKGLNFKWNFIKKSNVFKHQLNKKKFKSRLNKKYKNLLTLKQSYKIFYGFLKESLLKKTFFNAWYTNKKKKLDFFLYNLESRLDVILFRTKFFPSIKAAKQFINHFGILINNFKIRSLSYQFKIGDILSFLNFDIWLLFARNFYEKLQIRLIGHIINKKRLFYKFIKLNYKLKKKFINKNLISKLLKKNNFIKNNLLIKKNSNNFNKKILNIKLLQNKNSNNLNKMKYLNKIKLYKNRILFYKKFQKLNKTIKNLNKKNHLILNISYNNFIYYYKNHQIIKNKIYKDKIYLNKKQINNNIYYRNILNIYSKYLLNIKINKIKINKKINIKSINFFYKNKYLKFKKLSKLILLKKTTLNKKKQLNKQLKKKFIHFWYIPKFYEVDFKTLRISFIKYPSKHEVLYGHDNNIFKLLEFYKNLNY